MYAVQAVPVRHLSHSAAGGATFWVLVSLTIVAFVVACAWCACDSSDEHCDEDDAYGYTPHRRPRRFARPAELKAGTARPPLRLPHAPPSAVPAGTYVSRAELQVLNLLAIILHTLSGIAGVCISRQGNPQVTVVAPLFEYTTAAGEGVFFKPTPKDIFSVSILTPPVAVEFITAGFHVLYLLALCDRTGYIDGVYRLLFNTPSANPLRWFEYSVTATIMSAFGVISVGEVNFNYFVRGLFAGVSLQVLGYIIELLNSDDETGVPQIDARLRARLFTLTYWVLGQLINLPAIALLLYQVFGSKTHSAFWIFLENTLPFAVYFNTFGFICQFTFKRYKQFADPYFSERWYILLSLSTKLAVFWLSFGSFKKIIEDNGFSTRTGVDWNAVRYSAMTVPATVLVGYAVHDVAQWRNAECRKKTYVDVFFVQQ